MNHYQLVCEAYDLVCEMGMIGGSVARKLAAKGFNNLSPDAKNMFSQKRRNMLLGKMPSNITKQINKRNQSLMKLAANKHAQGALAQVNNAFNAQSPLTRMASSFKNNH